MTSLALSIFRWLFVAAALAGAYYSGVFARAALLFQQDTAASVPAAVSLVPYNASYVARLSSWQPENKFALLKRAVELNRFDVDAWIQLGLTAEMQHHDARSAEHYYLRAWQVDRMFLPRWTLTNFYFRQQDPTQFFRWANATLQITPYPADPVFMQMWLMSQDPDRIAAHIPDRAAILVQYASFLANAHQYTAVAPIVRRLVDAAGTRNPAAYGRDDQIGPAEDHLLADADLQDALDVWNSMKRANWVALAAPTPAHPLTNGNFQVPFFHHGFDWAPVPSAGVTIDQFPAEKNLRITVSGAESEHCVLMQQYIPLQPNRAYRLRWHAENQGIQMPSGLAWHLYPIPSANQTNLSAPDLLNPSPGTWDFTSPQGATLSLLTLEYTRPLGNTRAAGDVTLRQVALEEQ